MAKVIQVRDVPAETHARLVEHAAAAGLSLNQFLLREYERICRRADNRRLLAGLGTTTPTTGAGRGPAVPVAVAPGRPQVRP